MVESLIERARQDAESRLALLGKPIEICIGLSSSYSALLRGECDERLTPSGVLDWASRLGRVMLSGRGASGKSATMSRLALVAANTGRLPVSMDLSRWDHAASEGWQLVRLNVLQAADFLLRRFGAIPMDIVTLESVSPTYERILLLDGLNEVPGNFADEIVTTCDRLAAIALRCSVIISDRLVRRRIEGEEGRWCFAAPLPVSEEVIEKLISPEDVTHQNRRLLDSPFFLDRALHGELRGSALGTIQAIIEERSGVPTDLIDRVAAAAFLAYSKDASRSFSIERFADSGAAAAVEPLLASGQLVRVGDNRVAYVHHLYHDYLASRHVVKTPELLQVAVRHETLNTLTFTGNSFDAIAFALEQHSPLESDLFLSAVYDWHPYAAGYALAEVEAATAAHVAPSLRTIILAMLADKRFDRHFFSAQSAADALDLFRDKQAIDLRSATSREDLISLIASVPSGHDQFEQWRQIFTIASGSPAPPSLLETLASEESILGWTAANVLKRLVLEDDQIAKVISAARDGAPVVRWRACHVLGAFNAPDSVTTLLDRLSNDESEDVRYGAVRSLIELAATSEEPAADEILNRLGSLIPSIASSKRVMNELKRAVFLVPDSTPPHWSEKIADLLYPQALASQDVARLEEWSQLSARLRSHEQQREEVDA